MRKQTRSLSYLYLALIFVLSGSYRIWFVKSTPWTNIFIFAFGLSLVILGFSMMYNLFGESK